MPYFLFKINHRNFVGKVVKDVFLDLFSNIYERHFYMKVTENFYFRRGKDTIITLVTELVRHYNTM